MKQIRVIDSHTGGEPTRIIIAGGPDLGTASMAERVDIFRSGFDDIRTAVVCEPRGSDVWIGGLLCEPCDSNCATGIIFFNTAGYLGMCGHGTIGLMITLQHLKRIGLGDHQVETPVGTIQVRLESGNRVSLTNVPSYRLLADVEIEVPGVGPVVGDVAWGGGELVFLCQESRRRLEHQERAVSHQFNDKHSRPIAGPECYGNRGLPHRPYRTLCTRSTTGKP